MASSASTTTTTTFLRMATRILMDEVVSSGIANETDHGDVAAGLVTTEIGSGSGDHGAGEFNTSLFWCVNVFLMLAMVVACACCYCCGNKTTMHLVGFDAEQRRQESDRVYQRRVQERLEQQAALKVESPEKRKQKLVKSFQRHKVQMVRVLLLYACVCVPTERSWECCRRGSTKDWARGIKSSNLCRSRKKFNAMNHNHHHLCYLHWIVSFHSKTIVFRRSSKRI